MQTQSSNKQIKPAIQRPGLELNFTDCKPFILQKNINKKKKGKVKTVQCNKTRNQAHSTCTDVVIILYLAACRSRKVVHYMLYC